MRAPVTAMGAPITADQRAHALARINAPRGAIELMTGYLLPEPEQWMQRGADGTFVACIELTVDEVEGLARAILRVAVPGAGDAMDAQAARNALNAMEGR